MTLSNRSVCSMFWTTPTLKGIAPKTRLFLLYCETGPQSNLAGIFRLSWECCRKDSGLTNRDIRTAIAEATDRGFIEYHEECQVLWVIERFAYEFPNGKLTMVQKKCVERILCSLSFCELTAHFCKRYPDFQVQTSLFVESSRPWDRGVPPPMGTESREPEAESREPEAESRNGAATRREIVQEFQEEFWPVWPEARRTMKKDALEAYVLVRRRGAPKEAIVAAVEAHKKSWNWLKDGGQYIPHPHRWLTRERWTDAVAPLQQLSNAGLFTALQAEQLLKDEEARHTQQ